MTQLKDMTNEEIEAQLKELISCAFDYAMKNASPTCTYNHKYRISMEWEDVGFIIAKAYVIINDINMATYNIVIHKDGTNTVKCDYFRGFSLFPKKNG